MEREKILQWFEKINIDNYSLDQLIGMGVKEVPAIVVVGRNNKKEFKEGQMAFKWLQDQISNKRLSMSSQVNMNRQNLLQRNRMMVNNDGVVEFSNTEMGGNSDDYAYLATDIAQPKTFVGVTGTTNGILTYKEGAKVSDAEMKKRMSQAENSRKEQSENLKQVMKQGQLEAIYDNRMLK
jgi:hypothetical protein